MPSITATVRATAISATVGAASIIGSVVGQAPAPGSPVATVSGSVAGGRISGSVGGPSLVGIVTVVGGAAPCGDSWFGSW